MSDQWNMNESNEQNSDERRNEQDSTDAGQRKLALDKLRKILFGFAGLLLISPFLPFVTIPLFGSMNLVYIPQAGQVGDGIIYVILALLILVLNYLKKVRLGAVILSTLTFLMWIYHFSKMSSLSEYISFGFGAYLLFIASLGSMIVSLRMYLLVKKG